MLALIVAFWHQDYRSIVESLRYLLVLIRITTDATVDVTTTDVNVIIDDDDDIKINEKYYHIK